MSTENLNPPESTQKSREVRLGLVMYGGVSLAVYINGVAQEFFRTVRGRGVYKLIKALTDSDIIVDIISGTSAGGINGIVLAYALCNNKDFSSSANLWRRDGDIRSLLRSPNRDTSSESLLDSEGYYQPRLEDAFRYMPAYVPESEAEIDSPFNELDLFITGTDVDGNIFTQFDDAGHPIDVKDHRSVFLLKHRAGRKEPFNPQPAYEMQPNPEATYKALAKLSRLTSCFPAAFAPVHVSKDDTGEDRWLQIWGKLGKESCFLDGGVLDNKPFTYTLEAIFNRVAERRIDRKLFYIEPDPEHFTKRETASHPNILQATINSLIGLPGYESIANDLTSLARHNSKVIQYRRIIASLEAITPEEILPDKIEKLYRSSCLIAMSDRVVEGLFKVNGKSELLDRETRQAGAALVKAFDELYDEERAEQLLKDYDVYFRLRRLFRLTYVIEAELRKEDNKDKEKYKQLWPRINQQIELLDIVRVQMENLVDEVPIAWKPKIMAALNDKVNPADKVKEEAEAIWGIVEIALQKLLKDQELGLMIPVGCAESLHDKAVWPDQVHLSEFNKRLKTLITDTTASIKNNSLDDSPPASENIFCKTDAYEACMFSQILAEDDIVYKTYQNFKSIDAYLFPIELMANLHEKDVVETVRISPRDSEKGFSNKGLSDKVSGDALYHFGGFFKRSWRSNDILWGRLDGLCQLVETLLSPQIIDEIVNNKDWRQQVRRRFFKDSTAGKDQAEWVPALDPANLFPQAGEKTHQACRLWLEQLLSDDDTKRAEALEKKNFNDKIELIIEAAQLEILHEELPNVITDALGEQAHWNQFRLSVTQREQILAPDQKRQIRKDEEGQNTEASHLGYQPAGGNLDPFIAVLAATGQAGTVMAKLREKETASPERPTQTKLGRFFKNQYEVGTERLLHDMPTLILLEILAVSLLILRNCLLGVLGNQAARVKQNPLYILMVDYPLRVFYGLILFMRRAPEKGQSLLIGLAVFSIVALFVGLKWYTSIIYPPDSFNLLWFGVFIALPAFILTTEALFFLRRKLNSKKWFQLFIRLGFAALIAAPIFIYLAVLLTTIGISVGPASKSFILQKMAEYPMFLQWFSAYQTQIVQVMVIIIALILLFAPYLGWSLLLRWGANRRATGHDLRQILVDYFNIDELERIARKLTSSEMVEGERLPQILKFYLDNEAINSIKQKIKPYEEVECSRLQEVIKDYLRADKLSQAEKKLGVSLVAAKNRRRFLPRRTAGSKIEPARLKEVLKDYIGDEKVEQVMTLFMSPAASAIEDPSPRPQVEPGLELLPDHNGSLSDMNRTLTNLPLPLSRQRKMIPSGLVEWVKLQKIVEIYLSPLDMRQIINEKLGLVQQNGEAVPSEDANLQKVFGDTPLDVQEALKIIETRLASSKLIEWARLQSVIEEQISVNQVITKIRGGANLAQNIEWDTLKSLLANYASAEEIQNIAEDYLTSSQVPQIQDKLPSTLKNYVKGAESNLLKNKQDTFKSMAWPELREVLKGYVCEAEIRSIAQELLAGSTLEWSIIETAFKKHLSVQSLMKIITQKFTSSLAGENQPALNPRTTMAEQIVRYAKQNRLLRQLEDQMRFINVEAIYYL